MPSLASNQSPQVCNDFVFWNCNTLSSDHFAQLEILCSRYHPLMFGLCECKQKVWSRFDLPDYDLVSKPYLDKSGGLIMFVSHRVKWKRRQDLELGHPHILWLECVLPDQIARKILVGAAYKRPADGLNGVQAILESLKAAVRSGVPVLLGGDFNARHISWTQRNDTDPLGEALVTGCDDLGLHVLNSSLCPGVVTRPASDAVIDIVVTSKPNLFASLLPDRALALISDHLPLVLSCSRLAEQRVQPPKQHMRWDWETADWGLFRAKTDLSFADLNASRISTVAAASSAQDAVDNLYEQFLAAINGAADSSIGRKQVNVAGRKPWWSKKLELLLATYHAARRRYLKNRANAGAKDDYWRLRLLWRTESAAAKATAVERRNERLGQRGSDRIDWRVFSTKTPHQRCPLDEIEDTKGNVPCSLRAGADNLTTHFAKQCEGHTLNAPPSSLEKECIELASRETKAGDLVPTRDEDADFPEDSVAAVLAKAAVRAPGCDALAAGFLRNLGANAVSFLTFIYNFSWSRAVIPTCWKNANVTPILKSNSLNKSKPTSYRPISLTSLASKSFERLILPRLWRMVAGKISKFQTGFRKQQSTLSNIYRLYSEAQQLLNKPGQHHLSAAFLDLKAAFDRVWLPGLLFKLWRIGVRGRAWHWLRAFLTGRRIRVVHDGVESAWFPIFAGVPQGAVLSPFLFLVYINDAEICALQTGCEISLFADDMAVWPGVVDGPGDERLQACLDVLSGWARDWKVLFGAAKSQVVPFSHNRRAPLLKPFRLADFSLAFVDAYKYLGVWFHADLTWKHHLIQVMGKANSASAVIASHIRPGKAPGFRVVATLVKALLLPVISYGFPVWSADAAGARALDQLIARPLKRCLSLPQKSTPAASVLVDCGVLSTDGLLAVETLRFAHTILKMEGKDPCKSYFLNPRNFLAVAARRFSREIGVDFQIPAQMAKAGDRTLAWQWRLWLAEPGTSEELQSPQTPVKLIKLNPGTSDYLLHDNRRVSAVRARLRHDRASLALSLHIRRVEGFPSPNCPDCLMPESVEHCLLECKRLNAERLALKAQLDELQVPVNLDIVLGHINDLPVAKRLSVLQITAAFLQDIDRRRKL